jgi:extracellular factor (EF) 3-hydroxypalmitic acid methyl ester biosynthesis protein
MKNYEQLAGGRGRTVFYRPERYRARELFRRAVPCLAIGGIDHRLEDLSLNGLGASLARGVNDDLGRAGERRTVALGLKGVPLFQAMGEIARVEPTPFGTKVGLRLVDRCIDISALVAKSEEILVHEGLNDLASLDGAVDPEYRRLCADVVHLMRSHHVALDRFAQTKPSPQMAADMLAACEERALPRFRALWHAANALVARLDDEAQRAAKRFTELVVTPEFTAGAFCRRCYEKPLGYPGDFRVMNMVYDWRREGESLYDQFAHRMGLEVGECIATRSVMMRAEIAAALLRGDGSETAHIANLGCGSAREVRDYLRLSRLPRGVHFTLIDQDYEALSEVYEETYPEIICLKGQASVSCLHTSFSRLLHTGELFGKLPPQDLIYSIGLVDYLSDQRASALVAALYRQLRKGGTLVIGNMRKCAASTLWPMEFVCDWSIVYRDEAEIRALAAEIPDGQVATQLDPTGRVIVMRAEKP